MKSMVRFLDGWLEDWRDSQADRQTGWKIEMDISVVGNIKTLSYLEKMCEDTNGDLEVFVVFEDRWNWPGKQALFLQHLNSLFLDTYSR